MDGPGIDDSQRPKQHFASNPEAVFHLFNSPAFDSHAQDLMKEWNAPGLAAAIVHDQTTFSKAWGHARLNPPRQCTSDTLFDIASSSKSLTAVSVGLLVEDEQYPDVQWDAVMSKLLPDDFVMSREEYTSAVTVEDILSHRSGLPSHDFSYLGLKAQLPDDARSVTRNLRNLEIVAPIRTKWMYCNLMFTVATYLVERTSGMTFEDFLHKHIFGPLAMDSSHLQPDAAKRAGLGDRMAAPYDWQEHTKEYIELLPEQAPEAQGAGSIYTSVNDYIKYVKAMMNHEGPITKEIYKGVTRLRAFSDPDADEDLDPYSSAEAYAAGWEIYWYRGHKIVRHDGSVSGFSSIHFFMPDLKFGGVLLSNSDGGGNVNSILMKELVDEVLGIPASDKVNWNARQHTSEDAYEQKTKNEKAKLREELLAGEADPQPQKISLNAYAGGYWNAGYHGMEVKVKDEKLYIDAYDRSFNGFTMTFEHMREQTHYIVHWRGVAVEPTVDFKGDFRFENDRVVQMGLHLEEDMDDLIWFDRVQSTSAKLASR